MKHIASIKLTEILEKNSKMVFKASCHDEIGIIGVREKNFFSNQNRFDSGDKKLFDRGRKKRIKQKEE